MLGEYPTHLCHDEEMPLENLKTQFKEKAKNFFFFFLRFERVNNIMSKQGRSDKISLLSHNYTVNRSLSKKSSKTCVNRLSEV